MKELSFNQAMQILHLQSTMDKRKLNKLLRVACLNEHGIKLSTRAAAQLVSSYKDILDACYRLASDHFYSENGADFEGRIFNHYPPLHEDLKRQWIQSAHFAVFR